MSIWPEEVTRVTTSRRAGGPEPACLDDVCAGMRLDEFDLLHSLGTGSFARVFLARQQSLQRLVAVKVSNDYGLEPQMLARLDHDYIVRVFDQRILPDHGLKLLYMQYQPGGTLLDVLRLVRQTPPEQRSGQLLLDAVDAQLAGRGEMRPMESSVRRELARMSWPDTVAWLGRRLADALDYAHRNNVLHRDIKPANVLLTAEGVPKLADFNISFSPRLEGASPVDYFGGSLAYMSPEQLAACHPGESTTAADLDERADIYSLGVVLWELLGGVRPFAERRTGNGRTSGDGTVLSAMLADRQAGVSTDSMAALPPGVSVTLKRVLLTSLSPDREDRWRSGAELAQQLDLSMDSEARELVDSPPGSWRYRLRPWSILIMELGVVAPNVLAAYLNFRNAEILIADTLSTGARHMFITSWLLVNAIAFPVAGVVMLFRRRYLVLVPHGLKQGKTYEPRVLDRARSDALQLGDRTAVVIGATWLTSGTAWAVIVAAQTGELSARDYVVFYASLVLCAAIAIAYPFFLVATYAIRCLYPTFIPHGEVSADDHRRMVALQHRCTTYLALAAAIPLVGVAAGTFLPINQMDDVIGAVRALSIGGVLAFIGVYWLFRKLEVDLRALARVTTPDRDESA